MNSIMNWLVADTCPVVYDDWSDEFIWSCMMRVDGRYANQKLPDEVGYAISNHHSIHHDSHLHQVQDWCIGVRKNDWGTVETACSHDIEDDLDLSDDWMVI
jgi:hypothetical protein